MSSELIVIKNLEEFQSLRMRLETLYKQENKTEIDLHFPTSLLASVNSFFDQMIRQNGLKSTFFHFSLIADEEEANDAGA
jgi:hypothetical protein